MDTHHLVELPSNTPRPEVDFEQIDQWIVEGLNAHAASVVGSELCWPDGTRSPGCGWRRSIHLMLGASLDVQILGMAQAILDQAHQLQDPLGLVEAWNTLGQVRAGFACRPWPCNPWAMPEPGRDLRLARGLLAGADRLPSRALQRGRCTRSRSSGRGLAGRRGLHGARAGRLPPEPAQPCRGSPQMDRPPGQRVSLQAQVAMGERESSPPRTLSRLLGNYANVWHGPVSWSVPGRCWTGPKTTPSLRRASRTAALAAPARRHLGLEKPAARAGPAPLHQCLGALGEAHDLGCGAGRRPAPANRVRGRGGPPAPGSWDARKAFRSSRTSGCASRPAP